MSCTCPTCGQPAAPPLLVQGLLNLHMGPVSLAVMAALVRAYPSPLRRDRLIDTVWADDVDGGPENARNVVSVTIINLRQKLKPYGWTITSNGRFRSCEAVYGLQKLGGIAP